MTPPINAAGLDLVTRFEGLRLDAYQDVAGVWTIGYGHTRGVLPGTHITLPEAAEALQDDLRGARGAVWEATFPAGSTQNEFAAMVSLVFNIGSMNFRKSRVLFCHRDGNTAGAADAFLMWNRAHIGGVLQVVPGLTARRAAERALYLTPGEAMV